MIKCENPKNELNAFVKFGVWILLSPVVVFRMMGVLLQMLLLKLNGERAEIEESDWHYGKEDKV